MEEENKTESLPKQEPKKEENEYKSDASMHGAVENTRKVLRGAMRGISDPWGTITGQDWNRPAQSGFLGGSWKDQAEGQLGMILGTYPDAAMDIIGQFGGKYGKKADDFYDDVTRFENPNIQKARGILSVIAPSVATYGAISKATQNLPRAQRLMTQLGGNAVIDGFLGFTSDQNEGEQNTTAFLAENFPGWWGSDGRIPIPEWMKTHNSMTPEQLRIYHTWENSAFTGVADGLGFLTEYRKPIMSWFKPLNEKAAGWKKAEVFTNADKGTVKAISDLDDQIVQGELRKAEILQAIATKPGKAEVRALEAQIKQIDLDIAKAKAGQAGLSDEYANTGTSKATNNAVESSLDRRATSREIQADEVALNKLEADPTGANGFDPDITPGFTNDAQKTQSAMTPGNVAENMIDVTSNNKGLTKGDNTSIVSDAMYNKGFRAGGKSRNAVEGFAKQTEDMGDWEAIKNGFRFTRKDMDEAAWNIYENIMLKGDVRGVRKMFLANEDFLKITEEMTRQRALIEPIQQVEIDARGQFYAMRDLVDKFLGRSVTEASARTMDTLGREIETTAESFKHNGAEAIDPNKTMDTILDKLEFLMTEYGINKYISGWQLRNKGVWNDAIRRGEDLGELATKLNDEMEAALDAKHKAAIQYRQVLQDAADEDPNLLKAFVEAFAITDGDVDTIAKMHEWGVNLLHPRGIVHSARTGNKPNLLAKGLKTIRFNNVLSGMATINAAKGSATAIIGKPLRAFLHAGLDQLKTGDKEAIKRATYLYGAIQETNRRAIADGWKMIKRVHHDPTAMLDAVRKDYVVKDDKTWEALDNLSKNWEKDGLTGRVAMYETSKNLHKIGSNRWYRGAMTTMTGIDSYTNTMLATYWSRALAYEEAGKKGLGLWDELGKPSQALIDAEKKVYSTMFDKQGLPTDAALKQFAGEINLNLNHQFSDAITRATDALPIAQGLFMFPRTGINSVNRASSYTPFNRIPGFQNKYIKILRAGDDIDLIKEALAEHNIAYDTYPHAMEAYKVLKEEYEARLAFSGMLTSSLFALGIGGHIVNKQMPIGMVGTGDFRHSERKKKRDLYGVMEKSVQIPGTNKWISFKGVDALDPILSLIADVGQHYNDLSSTMLDDTFQKVMWSISANFLNETPLAGLEPLVALTSGDGSWFNRWAANEVRSYIPASGALGVSANMVDSAYKDVHNDFLGYIQNRTPLKVFLPNHVDIFTGDPIKGIENGWLRAANAVSPVKVRDGGEWWRRQLLELGWTPNTVLKKHSSGNYEYSTTEREIIDIYIGKSNFKNKVIKYLKNPAFKKEVQALRNSRLKQQSWTRMKLGEDDLPIFQYLNRELRKAQIDAEAKLAKEYPAMAESIADQIRINSAMKRGQVLKAVDIANENERNFKEVQGILNYANPPKQ